MTVPHQGKRQGIAYRFARLRRAGAGQETHIAVTFEAIGEMRLAPDSHDCLNRFPDHARCPAMAREFA
jgi:hypothetical protein